MEKVFKLLDSEDDEKIPEFEVMLNLSKNYSELRNFYKAVKVLEILVGLDDEHVEAWYLLGFNHFELKNFKDCSNCLENLKESIKKSGEEHKDIEEAAGEIWAKLETLRDKHGELRNNPLEEGNDYEEEIGNEDSGMDIDNDL